VRIVCWVRKAGTLATPIFKDGRALENHQMKLGSSLVEAGGVATGLWCAECVKGIGLLRAGPIDDGIEERLLPAL